MKLGYDLTIEQSQKLTMTPELIQAIQILQYNSQELEEFVQEEVMENPVLEYGQEIDNESNNSTLETKNEEYEIRAKLIEDEYDDISYNQWKYSKDQDETSFEQFVSKEETLEDFLYSQLSFTDLKGLEKKIGIYLIEAVDENGYITIDLEKLAVAFNTNLDTVINVLKTIQSFDPIGIGARNIEECLIIQLRYNNQLNDLNYKVISQYLPDLGANRLGKVAKEVGVTPDKIQEIVDLIRTLEPKPGRQFSLGDSVKYIIPDIIIEKNDGEYQVITNDVTVPRLMISPYYMSLVKSSDNDEELSKYLNNKYNSALWLIKSIDQRKQTIHNVACAVLNRQMDFFEKGIKYMKPLTLKEVAEDISVHESTVSRAINGKYMQTPMGVFEIKYFFSGGISDSKGEGISSNSIKTFIQEIIESEDSKKPYSDSEIVTRLLEKGIEISRRTVAKYREDMNILSSSKRKRY